MTRRRHGVRPHVARNVCSVKGTAFTTYDAAWAAVATTPDAVRAYRGTCCGYYHITRYTIDEFAQRIAEFSLEGCTIDDEGGIVGANDELLEAYDEPRDTWAQPPSGAGGPGATTLLGSPRDSSAPPSPADVARRLQARRSSRAGGLT